MNNGYRCSLAGRGIRLPHGALVKSLAVTCFPAKWLASFSVQEFYPGLVTELGNQHDDGMKKVKREYSGGSEPKRHAGMDWRFKSGFVRSREENALGLLDQFTVMGH